MDTGSQPTQPNNPIGVPPGLDTSVPMDQEPTTPIPRDDSVINPYTTRYLWDIRDRDPDNVLPMTFYTDLDQRPRFGTLPIRRPMTPGTPMMRPPSNMTGATSMSMPNLNQTGRTTYPQR